MIKFSQIVNMSEFNDKGAVQKILRSEKVMGWGDVVKDVLSVMLRSVVARSR